MEYITGFLALAFTAVFAAGSLTTGKAFAAKSRLELVFGAADAAVVLLGARLFMPWGSVSPWLWLVPVAIFAVGVAGAVLRWRDLPAVRPDKPRRRTLAWAVVHTVVLVAIVVVIAG
jgi:cytochrome b subunit of formate dehydrogenase